MSDSIADVRGKNRASIGYKKPPIETQFKPGQSGNPVGHPKSALYSDALRRKLTEVDPTDEHKRTYAEVLAEKAVLKARKVIGRMNMKATGTRNVHPRSDVRKVSKKIYSSLLTNFKLRAFYV